MIFAIANAPEHYVGVSDHRNKHGSRCPKTPVTRMRTFQVAERQSRSPSGMPPLRVRTLAKVDTPVLLVPLLFKLKVSVGRERLRGEDVQVALQNKSSRLVARMLQKCFMFKLLPKGERYACVRSPSNLRYPYKSPIYVGALRSRHDNISRRNSLRFQLPSFRHERRGRSMACPVCCDAGSEAVLHIYLFCVEEHS